LNPLRSRLWNPHKPFIPLSPGRHNHPHRKNEAGKTTFLEFTRRMLFGFPTGKHASKEYDPISGLVKEEKYPLSS
jgi:hypothetical protein